LPELARNFGKIMGEFRKATGDLRNTFEGHMRDLERETELRAARERAANSAVMTPLPNSSAASVDPQPPVPAAASADPSFIPADGIVSAKAPYSTAAGSTPASDATVSQDAQPTLFDPPARTDNAPAADQNHDPLPEK
jgi:Sec-independent protein translocase protein TatA